MERRYPSILRRTDPRNVLSKDYAQSKPECFESAEQYRQYLTLMRQSAVPRDDGYCLDCTPEFKEEMVCAGRCEHPETRFVLFRNSTTEDLEMIGVSSESQYWFRVIGGETVIQWRVDED